MKNINKVILLAWNRVIERPQLSLCRACNPAYWIYTLVNLVKPWNSVFEGEIISYLGALFRSMARVSR
jgi:hypothetical protein